MLRARLDADAPLSFHAQNFGRASAGGGYMQYAWDESMSTGVPDLDEQHRTLIAWINRLNGVDAGEAAEGEVVQILNFLATYARRHFAHEEECFVRYKCPHGEANRRAHEEFATSFSKLRADCLEHGVTAAKVQQLQQALGSWLENHIMRVDTSLRPCVR